MPEAEFAEAPLSGVLGEVLLALGDVAAAPLGALWFDAALGLEAAL